jgi:predicted anti-sigma-YlaC factor YlaD
MNHLPFKEWLLSDEPLTSEQNQAFQEHLRGCVECRQSQAAWGEVNNLFQRTVQVKPSAGFTDRWQSRLAARQARRQRIQLGIALAGGILLTLALLILLGSQLSGVLQSPTQFLLTCVAQLAGFFVLALSVQDYLAVIFNGFPLIPLVGVVLAVGFISFLAVGWLAAYQQLVIARRFAK